MTEATAQITKCFNAFEEEVECCYNGDWIGPCSEIYDKKLMYTHIFVGITTFFHALHSLPVYFAICERNSTYSTTFISLAIGGAISFGFQALLFPFTFNNG